MTRTRCSSSKPSVGYNTLILFLSPKIRTHTFSGHLNQPKEDKMRFYNNIHQYYCGIDLHTRTMYVCILDQQGNKLQHKNLSCSPQNLHEVIKPFLPNVVISVECMFTWYWIADFCQKENIPFVLGHASLFLYINIPIYL